MKALSRHAKAFATAIPFVAAIVLSGCSKGSATATTATYSPLTAVFSDAPVAGVTYKTGSGAAGTTDAQGRFNYAAGDSVTFSVGGMLMGSASPQLKPAGNAPVTPADFGLGPITSNYVSTIGQLLATLNSIAVAHNIDAGQPLSSGVFTMPDNAADILKPYVNLSPPINAAGLSQPQLAAIAASGVASVTSAAASAVISVPTQADAQLNLYQAVNASSVIGTVWTGDSGGGSGSPTGTFYFQPDGNMTGFISGTGISGLADGDILAGTWSGSITSGAGVQFSLVSPAGGNYSGTISNGGGTINDSSSNPVFTLTQIASSATLTNSLYLGGWYGVYTPTNPATNPDVYGTGTPIYLILSPDGTFSGIMDGNQSTTGTIGGNWTPTSGIGSGSFTLNPGTFSFNMATQSGAYSSSSGQTLGNIVFKRTGILSMNYSLPGASVALVPLTLNVQISWKLNSGAAVSGFPLALNLYSSSSTIPANLVASGIKPEINPLGNGAVAYTMADIISVPYPAGGYATNYVLSAGLSNCTITNGSGTITTDGLPAASYATVQITCP